MIVIPQAILIVLAVHFVVQFAAAKAIIEILEQIRDKK